MGFSRSCISLETSSISRSKTVTVFSPWWLPSAVSRVLQSRCVLLKPKFQKTFLAAQLTPKLRQTSLTLGNSRAAKLLKRWIAAQRLNASVPTVPCPYDLRIV